MSATDYFTDRATHSGRGVGDRSAEGNVYEFGCDEGNDSLMGTRPAIPSWNDRAVLEKAQGRRQGRRLEVGFQRSLGLHRHVAGCAHHEAGTGGAAKEAGTGRGAKEAKRLASREPGRVVL